MWNRDRDRGVRDDYRSPRRSRSISPDRGMRDNYRSPSRSRSFSRDHGAKDDYLSPRLSRSVSQSLSPRGERKYRTKQRSPSPRENGRSPHDERNNGRGRSRSPKRDSPSPSRSRLSLTYVLSKLSGKTFSMPSMLHWCSVVSCATIEVRICVLSSVQSSVEQLFQMMLHPLGAVQLIAAGAWKLCNICWSGGFCR